MALPHASLPPPLSSDHLSRDILANYDTDGDCFTWHEDPEEARHWVRRFTMLCEQITHVWKQRTLFPTLPAPAMVLGDIHGNFHDVAYFLKNYLVMDDVALTPCQLLCLGDYVDRGPHSLECVMVLFALALEAPEKVILLRGNHEDRVVCGDRRTYGADCFLEQCIARLGDAEGTRVFKMVTRVFRHLPLACELVVPAPADRPGEPATKILCAHGGFPRFEGDPRDEGKLALLHEPDFPRFMTLFPNNPMMADDSGSDKELPDWVEWAWYTSFDLMWSDPTIDDEAEKESINANGFARNSRGANVLSFSSQAAETFLNACEYSMLFRAHQEKQYGLRVSKSSRVLTLFSSSNYLGHGNGAGCAIVSVGGEVQLVMKS
jgi:protein phosphatase